MRLLVSGATATMEILTPRYPHILGRFTQPNTGNDLTRLSDGVIPWACDNGAFKNFNPRVFIDYIQQIRGLNHCLFLTVPDKVGNAKVTTTMFHQWYDVCLSVRQPLAYVLQDGVTYDMIPWNRIHALFIGGSTQFKLSGTAEKLAYIGKTIHDKHVHMGRVNSLKRIKIAYDWGCDSIDGTSTSMFPESSIPKFCNYIQTLIKSNRSN